MKLIVERSESTGDWWVRCVARNGRIVGTSQEGYRNKAYAENIANFVAMPHDEDDPDLNLGWRVQLVRVSGCDVQRCTCGGYRWHLVASNGRKVFGSREVLTKRAHAERMAYRVLTEAHELEVRG